MQNGLPSVITAIAIYLRGIMMNVLVMLPMLLCAAAFLLLLKPDTKELVTNRFLWLDLTGMLGETRLPFTILTLLILMPLLILYAVWVSLSPIKPIEQRQRGAKVAGIILVLAILAVLIEMHTALLRLAFELQNLIKAPSVAVPGTGKFFEFVFNNAKAFVLYVSPFVLLVLPFLKGLISKATTGESASWGDFARKLASRVILLFAASVVPLLLWLAMMQLAYWGTEIAQCPGIGGGLDCDRTDIMRAGWPHAPAFLQWYFEKTAYWRGAFLSFAIAAAALFLFWPILSVNSNSLHQLYRDRLGQAFLIKRKTKGSGQGRDRLRGCFQALEDQRRKRALSLDQYGAQRSRLEVCQTARAQCGFLRVQPTLYRQRGDRVCGHPIGGSDVDGLNIGTAMAISGAAAAPNMGMASIRPLSPTIALLNVRLGRWIRHPQDIAIRNAKLKTAERRAPVLAHTASSLTCCTRRSRRPAYRWSNWTPRR